ncbi:conserved oligomeric Golgi complex subunit 5, partial [Tremellales sp. Uapishka_1]
HKPFLSDKFDVNDYANAVLQGRTYRPDEDGESSRERESGDGRGDMGVEVARLNYGIEDVTRQLRQEITAYHPLLLTHLTTSLSLSSHLSPIRSSLTSLSTSLDRLHTKIHNPHQQLSLLVRRLNLLAQASDLTRRAARFVLVARRLEEQMLRVEQGDKEGEREREMAKAALSVAELDALLKPTESDPDDNVEGESPPLPLLSLTFVKDYAPVVDKARDSIIQEMEGMVVNGLADLNQPLLSSSLQTAHNLRLLPELVANLLADLNDAVILRISRAFDSAAIGREVAAKDGSSSSAIKFTTRSKTEPTSSNTQQWVAVLWSRLERVIEDVANCCIKVYTLEKVLRVKKDAVTQVEFLDEVMKTLDEKPSFTFWTTLATAFETQTKEAARSSAWLQQALSVGYPRFLRLFHDFFAKIAVHTDTVYTREHQSPEAVLVLRSIATFETLYLSRSTSRMTDVVNTALSQYVNARGKPPGATEGVSIARTITNDLDSARFDPLLVRTVARNAVKVLDGLISKIDNALVRDFTATSLIGPNATAAQGVNSQLVSCLYHLVVNLGYCKTEFTGKVWEILVPSIKAAETSYRKITDALDVALRREFTAILGRIHRVDFGKPMAADPMGMGSGGGSPYMKDLVDKLGFVRTEVLGRMSLGEMGREWVADLCRYIVKTFLLHASIASPLGESGKLKLTGDMTELEFALGSFLTTGQVQGQRGGMRLEKIGEEYLALRSFRTLLFVQDISSLANPVETVHLPPLIILHHLIVLSPLDLPHQVHKWSEMEYVAWLDKHSDEETRLGLVESSVDRQVGKDGEGEFVRLIREVLEHARHEEGSPAGI